MENLISLAFANETKQIISILEKDKNIDLNENSTFIANICANNNMELLCYLLEDSNLKYPINIHLDNEKALCSAIYGMDGETNLEIVKYLLTSTRLKEHSILPKENYNLVYLNIFKLKKYEDSFLMINYLCLEYAVEKKDEKIYKLLMNHADTNELRDKVLKNLMTVMEQEKEPIYQLKLNEMFEVIISNYSFSLEMINYLCLEYAIKNRNVKIYRLLINNNSNKENENIKNNLILAIEKENDDFFREELEKTLCRIDNNFYKKYKINKKLNKELVINSGKTVKKL